MTKKRISLVEFDACPINIQLDILQQDGVYVGKRLVEDETVVLYQLHSFYVEVFFKTYRQEVNYLITSDHLELLHPYLDQVRLKGLDKSMDAN